MLSHGRDLLSTPGPSVVPDAVLQAMHRPAPNIYTGEMIELALSLYPDLQRVACTSADPVIYTGNGHAAWEAALSNTLSKGDKVLALACGRFTVGWADMAKGLGLDVEIIESNDHEAVDPEALRQRLLSDKGRDKDDIKAVITTQTDTSSSVKNDIPALRQAIDDANHGALLMVDCIASLGCEPYYPDDWGIDVTIAACQKGLMTPPGLAFNFVGRKAWLAHENAGLRTPYWNWESRVHGAVFHQKSCGTPPTHHYYGLRKALDMLLDEGMPAVWQRHRTLASAVWAATDAWSQESEIRLNVAQIQARSTAVTTLLSGSVDADALRTWCEQNTGLTLGVGLAVNATWGDRPKNVFRIGHMGHINATMLMGALGAIDTGLKALAIPHGSGALEAASNCLANSFKSR